MRLPVWSIQSTWIAPFVGSAANVNMAHTTGRLPGSRVAGAPFLIAAM